MNMETTEALEKIGLNEKEASVYLALLELGTAPVQSIALKAGLKRPTTYLILDNLQAKGLVSIVPRAKKALYVAESPEYLIGDLSRKEDLLKRFLPNLLAVYNLRKDKPQVQMFEGVQGVKQIYQKIFDATEVWFFGTTREVSKIYTEGVADFIQKAQKHNLKVRDLLASTPEDWEYARRANLGAYYQIRFMPKDMSFLTDSAIFGNNVVFFSFRPATFSVMITSNDISKSLKYLFDLAWQSAEPLQKT